MRNNGSPGCPIRVIEEPGLNDLLADPTTRLLMESDGVREDDVVQMLAAARAHLRASGETRLDRPAEKTLLVPKVWPASRTAGDADLIALVGLPGRG